MDLRSANDTLDGELTRWLETTTSFIREKLAEFGVITTTKLAAGRTLAKHTTDWHVALVAKGTTAKHTELVTSRAKTALEACGFVFWSDITANCILGTLAKMREVGYKRRGISVQTFNFYLQAVKQFSRGMVDERRASESPLSHLKAQNVKTDRCHDRRALSADELRRLIDVTKTNATRASVTGAERAVLYRVAARRDCGQESFAA